MVAKLIVASGKSAGRSISLKHGKLLIGRAEECDIRPLGEEVSRRHCAVVAEGDGLTVEDLKSRNGTFVNGVKIAAKVAAADGDVIRVGPLELKVSYVAPAASKPMDDISRWLMADDEPAGMFDTTQTVRAPDPVPTTDPPQAGDAANAPVPEGTESAATSGDSSSATVLSGIEALIAARGASPSGLPAESRGQKAGNSKDAAADALKKFFGRR